MLTGEGLDHFYELRGDLAGPAVRQQSFELLDESPFLKELEDGRQRVRIGLEGLHCVACIWLIEKSLQSLKGVAEARVHFGDRRVDVILDGATLVDVLNRLQQVGYRGKPLRPDQRSAGQEESGLTLRLAVAGFGAGNMMTVAAALYLGQFEGMEANFSHFFEWITLLLCTPVVLYSGRPFFEGALRALRYGALTMDVPIALGLSVTYLWSLVNFLRGQGPLFFDTATAFVFVLLVGRYLEAGAQHRAGNLLENFLSLAPGLAERRVGDGFEEVPTRQLKVGDRVRVKAGGGIPADGLLVEGFLEVDESLLTGESRLVDKTPGRRLFRGTRVTEGEGEFRLQSPVGETLLDGIAELVESAQSRATEGVWVRYSGVFIAFILACSALGFFWWLPMGLEKAATVALSVLIITCPCALGLAAPLAVWAGMRKGLSHGVLFRESRHLWAAPEVRHLLLDKTGTLTTGDFELNQIESEQPELTLRLAAACEKEQQHPLARVILKAAEGLEPLQVDQVEVEAGRGLSGLWEGRQVRVGKGALPGVYVELEGEFLGRLDFVDQPRPEARECLEALRQQGMHLAIVSGDAADNVERVAGALGVEDFAADLSPEQKHERVLALQKYGKVAMLGDGINDSPALAAADLGLAVCQGADIAHSAAHVVLLRPGLEPLLKAFETARFARRRLRQNLGISAVYNLMAVPLALAGWVTPLLAAVAMPLASLAVVINAVRRS